MALTLRLGFYWTLMSLTAFAAESEPISFEKILRNTLEKNAQIQESVQDIEIARQQLERANAALFPTAASLFATAQARPSAAFCDTPRAIKPSSMWRAWRLCLPVYFELSPRGIGQASSTA